ncbi:hypothetical protein EFO53_08545 [Lacticaseibacillus rhamnosus]|uniref:Uncharacterized protein n=1 Tax=Lacticaseibacillus rhamnosus TaxID=47715 RepID=A0AB74IBL3_LACRH|nr:hypothetical protein A0F16_12110 [Lacticaseibacillus rhamnosus]OFP81682.1 hypothetical protein HMPREF2969_12095 [Lactobacillus sp. HMSC056D05]OFR79134.1 hypothetical protein HMPREF2869_02865 [Lactobacillus sp. HMSC061B07]KIC97737.1 hypothetical protein LaR308_07715 [Lacticaseibacillus rhamnosus]KMO56603.1 hypothetical protein PZ03_06895 [Lacticaseibacillus rhamnosus]
MVTKSAFTIQRVFWSMSIVSICNFNEDNDLKLRTSGKLKGRTKIKRIHQADSVRNNIDPN